MTTKPEKADLKTLSRVESAAALNVIDFQNGFQFNVLGILNTNRDNSIYKITAFIGDLVFEFKEIDWQTTT